MNEITTSFSSDNSVHQNKKKNEAQNINISLLTM